MSQLPIRVGTGYDVHRLVPDRPLVLGGVRIAHSLGLIGHSDADVLLHALMDALLGAAGMDDIGHHFPPGDERYRDASSVELLGQVGQMVSRRGWQVANVDTTIVAEQPKVAPYVPAMKRIVSETLGIPEDRVGIKATTNEGMGFLGREEGIAALAVALLIKTQETAMEGQLGS